MSFILTGPAPGIFIPVRLAVILNRNTGEDHGCQKSMNWMVWQKHNAICHAKREEEIVQNAAMKHENRFQFLVRRIEHQIDVDIKCNPTACYLMIPLEFYFDSEKDLVAKERCRDRLISMYAEAGWQLTFKMRSWLARWWYGDKFTYMGDYGTYVELRR